MLRISFRPIPDDLETLLMAARHRRLWKVHGDKVTTAFEASTGVSFTSGISARVMLKEFGEVRDGEFFEWSHSGATGTHAMLLCYQNSYILESEILWQLLHEMGHRLLGNHLLCINRLSAGLSIEEDNYESHRLLFVFLLDVIDQAFDAEPASAILKQAKDNYFIGNEDEDTGPYARAWKWAEGLTKKRRSELTKQIFDQRVLILPQK